MKLVNLESIYRNGYCFGCLDINDSVIYEHVFIEDPTIQGLQGIFGSLDNVTTINFTIESDTIKIGKIFVPYYSYDCESAPSDRYVKLTLGLEDFDGFIECLDQHIIYALILAYCKNVNLNCYYVVSGNENDLMLNYQLPHECLNYIAQYIKDNAKNSVGAFTEIDGVTIALDTITLVDKCKSVVSHNPSLSVSSIDSESITLSKTFVE